MPIMMLYLLAATSTTGLIALWFWVVRKELRTKQNILESAGCQLAASRAALLQARNMPESEPQAQAVLARSQDIYRQAAEHYNNALKHPLCYLPGLLMGYRVCK